jgi:hypothetical protein
MAPDQCPTRHPLRHGITCRLQMAGIRFGPNGPRGSERPKAAEPAHFRETLLRRDDFYPAIARSYASSRSSSFSCAGFPCPRRSFGTAKNQCADDNCRRNAHTWYYVPSASGPLEWVTPLPYPKEPTTRPRYACKLGLEGIVLDRKDSPTAASPTETVFPRG